MSKFKSLKISCISLFVLSFVFALSFSALQACSTCSTEKEKSGCSSTPCGTKEKTCAFEVTKVNELSTSNPGGGSEIVLNVKGMTCGGCANRVKGSLIKCAGVKDATVSHKDGKATVSVEKGKVKTEELIKAVESAGFSASEG